jgi:phosphoribosylformylglycinamidine synthase
LIGASIDFSGIGALAASPAPRLDGLLFGETQSRVVVSCKPLDAVKVIERAKLLGVPAARIGSVGGDKLVIKTGAGEFSMPAADLHDAWWHAIARAMS